MLKLREVGWGSSIYIIDFNIDFNIAFILVIDIKIFYAIIFRTSMGMVPIEIFF